MNSPIAHNIPIPELISALTDMMVNGNKYVDVLIDEEFILRLRGLKSLKDDRKKKGKGIGGKQIPPLPGDIDIMDLM